MRISDWSSDVCVSDLLRRVYRTPARVGEGGCRRRGRALRRGPEGPRNLEDGRREARAELSAGLRRRVTIRPRSGAGRPKGRPVRTAAIRSPSPDGARFRGAKPSERISTTKRSEEHTSELQSLMRISYAVFCLNKKNKKPSNTTQQNATQQS